MQHKTKLHLASFNQKLWLLWKTNLYASETMLHYINCYYVSKCLVIAVWIVFLFFHSFLTLFISGFLSTLHFPSHPQQGFLRHGIADLQFPGGLAAFRKNTFRFYKYFGNKFLILFWYTHNSPGSSVGRALGF